MRHVWSHAVYTFVAGDVREWERIDALLWEKKNPNKYENKLISIVPQRHMVYIHRINVRLVSMRS